MKVIHLVTFFENSYAGGIQRYVSETARLQRQSGIDASVLTVTLPVHLRPAVPPDTADEWNSENRGLPVTERRAWAVFYRTPVCPALLNDLRHLNADILHLHGPSPWLEFALRLVTPRSKLVLTVHNSFPASTAVDRFLSRHAGLMLKKTMALSSAVIFPSETFLEEIASHNLLKNRDGRIHVIPPGINHERFYPLNLRRDERRVLFVGHLRREKGLHILIQALSLLPDCRLQVMASVSYESEYFKEVRRLAREKCAGRIEFVLNPDNQTLLEAYNTAACVVVPSTGLESWNLVLLEAASCGTACVRTNLQPLAWADFAEAAPPGDAPALAACIRRALEKRASLETAAFQASRGYSWEQTATRTSAVYKGVIA